jgi:hypothetical protein
MLGWLTIKWLSLGMNGPLHKLVYKYWESPTPQGENLKKGKYMKTIHQLR